MFLWVIPLVTGTHFTCPTTDSCAIPFLETHLGIYAGKSPSPTTPSPSFLWVSISSQIVLNPCPSPRSLLLIPTAIQTPHGASGLGLLCGRDCDLLQDVLAPPTSMLCV